MVATKEIEFVNIWEKYTETKVSVFNKIQSPRPY